MRPRQYWRGFWVPWAAVVSDLLRRVRGGRRVARFSRRRQQYWWRGYQIQAHIEGVPLGVKELLMRGRIVATHSLTHREIVPLLDQPHRIFASTPPCRSP